MTADTRPHFTRCVVIVNPVSTHAVPVKRRIKALKQLFPGDSFKLIETSADGRIANQKLLSKHRRLLGPDTLLCIAAGDGTTNMFAEGLAVLADLPEAARRTVLLPLWGGNANDLAFILNGRPSSVPKLLEDARVVEVRPLECIFKYADGSSRTRIAACYISLGASGYATKELASESHRNHPLRRLHLSRILLEFAVGMQAFSKAPSFGITEHSRTSTISELMIINGPRYAKLGRTPVGLKEDRFFMHALKSSKPLATAATLIKIGQSRPAPKSLHTETSFTVEDPTLAQLDGELLEVPAGTKVHIRLANKPLHMLSTRLT